MIVERPLQGISKGVALSWGLWALKTDWLKRPFYICGVSTPVTAVCLELACFWFKPPLLSYANDAEKLLVIQGQHDFQGSRKSCIKKHSTSPNSRGKWFNCGHFDQASLSKSKNRGKKLNKGYLTLLDDVIDQIVTYLDRWKAQGCKWRMFLCLPRNPERIWWTFFSPHWSHLVKS